MKTETGQGSREVPGALWAGGTPLVQGGNGAGDLACRDVSPGSVPPSQKPCAELRLARKSPMTRDAKV